MFFLLALTASVVWFAKVNAQDNGGNEEVQAAIVGGSEAPKDAWPWKVFLKITIDGEDYRCGGSLIDEEWVLTAAHCVTDFNGNILGINSFKVLVGRHDITTEEGEEFGVKKVIRHLHYDDTNLRNDIALLQLTGKSSKSPVKLPSPIYMQSLMIGDPLVVIGWGKTRPGDDSSVTNVLMQVWVPLVSSVQCVIYYPGSVSDKIVCAGTPAKDSCNGDSGGPLMSDKLHDGWTIIGIVSWGFSCANKPGIYTNVAAHLDWIKTYIEPNSCTIGQVSSASTTACGEPVPTPVPAPTPAPNNPNPAPTPNPSDFSGISFYREKNYGVFIKKLGYGLFNFADDFLSVRMDRSDMRFYVVDAGGGKDCFDYNRLGGRPEYPSFNDHGEWWQTTVRVSVEYGSCPQSNPPAKKIILYRQTNFGDQLTVKEVGWEGDFTDNFQSVRLDEGVSFYARDERGVNRCFDLGDFNGRNESATFGDHGDWWQNTVWMRVQGHLCEPHDVHMTSPVKGSSVPYNTDITVQFNVPYNTISVYGELHGLSEVWRYNQPANVNTWHLGYLPPGNYTVWLRAANDNGSSNWTENKFSVQGPTCNNFAQVGGIGLFRHANCNGDWANITQPGIYLLGALAQQVSTVLVQPGWSVEVRQGQSTSDGGADCISQTRTDLSQWRYYQSQVGMNDNSLTVQVYNVPNCGRQSPLGFCHEIEPSLIALYDYTYCGGSDRQLTAGVYELADIGFDNMTTSFEVPVGKSIMVHTGSGRTGDFACWNSGKWFLYVDPLWNTSLTADNIISTIAAFDVPNCGGLQVPQAYLYLKPTVITTETDLVIAWPEVWAQQYKVSILSENGIEVYSSGVLLPTTSFVLPRLAVGKYAVTVQAVTPYENAVSAPVQYEVVDAAAQVPTIPEWPRNVRTAGHAATSIQVLWDDSSDNELGFVIWQWVGQGYQEIGRVGAGVTSFTATNLQCQTQYHFAVSAFNGSGQSERNGSPGTTTQCQQQTSPPNAPSEFKQNETAINSIGISWRDNSENEDGFSLYQLIDGNYKEVAVFEANGGSGYTIGRGITMACGERRIYRLDAFNSAGRSLPTEPATVTSMPCTPSPDAKKLYLPLVRR